ncbi:hypothetical protein GCM10020221_25300 [Streptomyces thioluteus]|uniref:Cell envelope-related transcriptional attenuator domain-containing protein n=1 Tax=Streptomyces thioluteus TaxID=66431 RepID=A0ABP6JC14_STRTU
MNQWPEARNNDPRNPYGSPGAPIRPEGSPSAPPRDGYNTGQVYGRGGGAPGPRTTRPNWRKRITIGLLAFVAVLLVVSVSTYFWADSKLRREVDLGKVADRPPGGEGTNYLIVGSDSREGLSDADKKDLHTGSADGKRTDSMMILHTGDNGTTMLSLPRDSFVTIPAFTGQKSGKQFPASTHKLNVAYADGGAELLIRTVEFNTRAAHRPLRGDRLRRVPQPGRLAGRRGHVHRQADQGP